MNIQINWGLTDDGWLALYDGEIIAEIHNGDMLVSIVRETGGDCQSDNVVTEHSTLAGAKAEIVRAFNQMVASRVSAARRYIHGTTYPSLRRFYQVMAGHTGYQIAVPAEVNDDYGREKTAVEGWACLVNRAAAKILIADGLIVIDAEKAAA